MARFINPIKRTCCLVKPKSCPLKKAVHLPNLFFIGLIRLYQIALSPILPRSCRFIPTCSAYGHEAFKRYNLFKAMYLTAWRILRCNPFNKGGYDPLP